MIIAPGADFFAIPLPKKAKASSRPKPGPGLEATIKKMDLPVSEACCIPSG